MTPETFVVAVAIGLVAGALFTMVMKDGGYGLLGDLTLGLAGSTIAVLIGQLVGLVPYAGMAGAIAAAFLGGAVLIVVQRKVWSVPATGDAR